MKTIPSVVAQHAEEAAFLLLLRERIARSSQFGLGTLAEFDGRVHAHLDGVRASSPRRRASALVAAGRQGALELAPLAAACQSDPDPEVREEAAWTATLLGVSEGPKALCEIAFSTSRRADEALDFAVRALGP